MDECGPGADLHHCFFVNDLMSLAEINKNTIMRTWLQPNWTKLESTL